MTFAERATNPPPPRDLCPVGLVLVTLPDDEREHLTAMLADTARWGHTGKDSIQEAIEDEGHGRVSDRSIRGHRGGTCICAGTRPKR